VKTVKSTTVNDAPETVAICFVKRFVMAIANIVKVITASDVPKRGCG
jgi:hypothetical protein